MVGTGTADEAAADRVYFVGAGASLTGSAGLPLFGDILAAAIEGLQPLPPIRLEHVAPEALLRALVQAEVEARRGSVAAARRRVEKRLLDGFSSAGASPNAVHFVLASEMVKGAAVWTTNYDTLVEDAAEVLAQRLGSDPPSVSATLRKPHGTFIGRDGRWVDSKKLIFAADQVVMDWSDEWERQFVQECTDRELVFIGLSGLDVNSFRALTRGIQAACSVRWFAKCGHPAYARQVRKLIQFRFPLLTPQDIVLSENPSRDFVNSYGDAAELRALALPARDLNCEIGPQRWNLTELRDLCNDPWYRAWAMTEVGERSLAHEQLMRAARQWAPPRAWLELGKRLKHSRLLHPLRRAVRVATRTTRRFPMWSAWGRCRSLTDHKPRSPRQADAMLRDVAQWLNEDLEPLIRCRLLLIVSRLSRDCGNYRDAINAAEQVLALARVQEDPLPTEAAWAQVELFECERLLGNFGDAFNWSRLRLESLAMIHWDAWMRFEIGCLHLQLGELSIARGWLEEAARFFASSNQRRVTAYDSRLASASMNFALVVLERCAGHLEAAEATLDRMVSGPPRSLTRSLINFQRAEIARSRGRTDDAMRAYNAMNDDWEFHRGVSQLGQAFCLWGDGAVPTKETHEAARVFMGGDSSFGLAHCARLARSIDIELDTGRQSGEIEAWLWGNSTGVFPDWRYQLAWV